VRFWSISGTRLRGSIRKRRRTTLPKIGSYLVCAWLGDSTSAVAAGSATFSARGPQVSQLTVQLPAPPRPGIAYQIDYTTRTDQQLSLYSIVKPASGLPCASSFELEQQQNQSESVLIGSDAVPIFGGPATNTATDTKNRGPYVICTWIEGPNNGEVDAASSVPIYAGTPASRPPRPADPHLRLTHVSASRRHGAGVRGTTAAGLTGRLVASATCGRVAISDRPAVAHGHFAAHLQIPRACRKYRSVLIRVTWNGSKSFARQSVTDLARIDR
jgi:hypothetical protein